MQILEILNTKPTVAWTVDGYKNLGHFDLDGRSYVLHLDEYEFGKKSLVDLGFDTDGEYTALEQQKSAAKVIGAVVNGALPKLRQLDPDFILISVRKGSGLIDSRKSLYSTVIMWIMKRATTFTYASTEWIENAEAFYKVLAKKRPTEVELKTGGVMVAALVLFRTSSCKGVREKPVPKGVGVRVSSRAPNKNKPVIESRFHKGPGAYGIKGWG